METKFVPTTQKTGNEKFEFKEHSLGVALCDFWSWAYSDLVNNTERGKLAEFIVASALGVHDKIAATWDSFDLKFMDKGIEVKSAAFLQSWSQEKESYIEFAIRPTLGIIENTGTYDNDCKRQADAYVCCFLKHLDKLTLNPLNLDQWEFYVVSTALLNKLVPKQKKIALSFFAKNDIKACRYSEIRGSVVEALNDVYLTDEKGL